jgi:lysophospholipase L1-like esterase
MTIGRRTIFTNLRIGFCALVLCFGALAHDVTSGDLWLIATAFLYLLPLLAQLSTRTSANLFGVYLAVFLFAQALCKPEYFRGDYLTLPPNMDEAADNRGFPGISGLSHITTDERGFRVTRAINYNNGSTYRIFAIGGSTTKQIRLGDKKTWTHLLQEALSATVRSDIEVVNTGLHGLRAVHHLATLNETLRLEPDMYVFMLGANDWMKQALDEYRTLTDRIQAYSLSGTFLGSILDEGYGWLLKARRAEETTSVAPDRDGADVQEKGDGESVDPYLLRRGSLYRTDQRTFTPRSVPPQYVEMLEEVVATCRQHSVACVFTTQPIGYKQGISSEFKRSFWMTPPWASYTLTFESSIRLAALYNDFLRRFAAERRLPLCDLDAAIEPSFENFYDEMHFNEQGARNVATSLHECLDGLIPTVSGEILPPPGQV